MASHGEKDSTLLASEGALALGTPRGTPREDNRDPEADALEVGAFVGGRYRVVRFIARGGMGEVYEAFDEELRVAVALKVATKSTGRALDRFKREVMLARRVTHRNVCRLFEIGFETVRGEMVPYCTMELLEGETLSARLERGQVTLGEARGIIEQIATGLQAAHDVGVIHRDFKSNNILLVKDADGRERAVISDFGLARAETSIVGDGAALTADQALVGTPAYMAPEQVECKPATMATDIYALGVVMFELVTGQLPFRADTPMATAVLRLTQPVPSVRARRPELSASWEVAIARCLELEPAKRFARAGDVIDALDAEVPRRSVVPWLAAGAVVAAGAAAAVMMFGSHGKAQPVRTLPPAGPHARGIIVVDPTGVEPWRATEAGELMRAELRVRGFVNPLDGTDTAPLARELAAAKDREGTKAVINRIGGTTNAQLLITSEVAGDRLQLRLIDLVNGDDVGSYAVPMLGGDLIATTAEVGKQLRPKLAGAEVPLDADHSAKVFPAQPDAARAYAEGLMYSRAHDHQHAIAALERATSLAKDFAPAYMALVVELRAVRQMAKAGEAAERAYKLAPTMRSDEQIIAEALYRESRKEWSDAANLWRALLQVDPDDVRVAIALARSAMAGSEADKCYEVLDRERMRPPPIGDDPRIDVQEAMCARQVGDFVRARSAATRADMKAFVRGPREVYAEALSLEGEMLANGGEYDRALVVLGRAKQAALGLGDGERVIEAERQIGYVLAEQGKTDEATTAYHDAIARAKQLGDHLAEGIVLNDYGQSVRRPQEAAAIFKDALVIAKAEGDERLVIAVQLNLANKLDDVGDVPGAIASYEDVIARAKKVADQENLATAQMNEGDSLIKLEREREALPLIDAALTSYKDRGDEDGVGYALVSRGDAQMGLGDFAAARASYEESLAQREKLGEQHTVAATKGHLARLALAEEKGADAEKLMRDAIAQYRTEDHPEQLAEGLRRLANALVMQGKRDEAIAALDESERIARPDEASVEASENAMMRGLADPAHADAQLAIIHAVQQRTSCPDCTLFAPLDEAELELGLGHTARGKALLADVLRRAKATHSASVIARVELLQAKY